MPYRAAILTILILAGTVPVTPARATWSVDPAHVAASVLPARAAAPVDPAQVAIARYEVDLDVREDGSFDVAERITFRVVSGEMTFGSRHLPTRRLDRIADLAVTSTELGPLEVSERARDGRLEVRWEHAPTAEGGTIVLTYRVAGALREIGNRNEVFWAAVGPEWDLPIHSVETRLTLPEHFAAEADSLELDPAVIPVREGERWVARFTHGSLDPGEGFQIRAGFPWIMDGRPVGLRRPEVQAGLAGLLLALLGFVWGIRGIRSWRSAAASRQTGPPTVRLEDAAVLLHEGTGAQRAFPALVLDLARRGHLTLASGSAGGEEDDDDVNVRVRVHPNADDELGPFEVELLEAVSAHDSLEAFGTEGEADRKRLLADVQARLIGTGLLVDRVVASTRDRRTGIRALIATAALLLAIWGWGIWWLAAAGGTLGFGLGRLVRGHRRVEPSDAGRRVQGEVLAWLGALDEALERAIAEDPVRAASHYIDWLPWVTIGPAVNHQLDQRLREALDEEERELPVPAWVEDNTRAAREALDGHSLAYAAFFQVQETAARTALLSAPGAGVSAVYAGSTATATMMGAVGAGAVGGGGGTAG